MDEEVIKQQNLLAKTLELAIARMEEAAKLHQERAAQLAQAQDTAMVLIEALRKSLSENDQQIDDLAKITALWRAMYQAQPGAQAEG